MSKSTTTLIPTKEITSIKELRKGDSIFLSADVDSTEFEYKLTDIKKNDGDSGSFILFLDPIDKEANTAIHVSDDTLDTLMTWRAVRPDVQSRESRVKRDLKKRIESFTAILEKQQLEIAEEVQGKRFAQLFSFGRVQAAQTTLTKLSALQGILDRFQANYYEGSRMFDHVERVAEKYETTARQFLLKGFGMGHPEQHCIATAAQHTAEYLRDEVLISWENMK